MPTSCSTAEPETGSELHSHHFSTLYTTLPHHLIEDKLIALIEHRLTREKTLYLACNEERFLFLFSLLMYIKMINYGPVNTFVKLLFIFWIIFSLDLELNITETSPYS